jgi:hypothetical protein
LQPFLVTAWHGAEVADIPPDVKAIFTRSELSKDPKRLNLFVFLLDHQGRTVHSFHGLPGGARGGDGRSDYTKEIPSCLAKLKLPADQEGRSSAVPDLKATVTGVPAGVRLFVRLNDEKDPIRSRVPVVEVVALKAEDWKALALPTKRGGPRQLVFGFLQSDDPIRPSLETDHAATDGTRGGQCGSPLPGAGLTTTIASCVRALRRA